MRFWDWFLSLLLGDRYSARGADADEGVATAVATIDEEAPAEAESSGEEEAAADGERPWWDPPDPVFTEFQAPAKPAMSRIAAALENVLSSQVAAEDVNLPPMPHGVERILSAIERPGSNATKIAELVGEDQVRAAAVLRTANSAMFASYERVTRLPVAVARIGTEVLRTVMMRESLRAATLGLKGADAKLAKLIWERALAAACIMRGLANFTGVNPEDACVIGLLYDIGTVGILREAAEQSKMLRQHVNAPEFEYLCHIHHENFGRHVAAAWHLPQRLQEIIADHHREPAADDPLRAERLMIQLTEMILSRFGFSPPLPYRILESPVCVALKIHDGRGFVDFLKVLPNEIQQAVGAD